MKRFAVILPVIVLIAASIAAFVPHHTAARDYWVKVRSQHFTLIGNASEKDIRRVAARLEQFREAISQLLTPSEAVVTIPITVIVFKNDASYKPFKPLYQGKPAELTGYFQSSNDAAYITLAARWRDADPYAVIFHEYVHAMTSARSGRLPTWIDEGIAEYYSTFVVTRGGKKVWIGKPVANHVRLLKTSRLLPLRTLFELDQSSPLYNEGEKKSVFYAQSWALVHFLLHGQEGRRRVQFSHFIQATERGQPLDETFKRIFQNDVKTIEGELNGYIGNNSYPSQELALDRKVELDESMQSEPIGQAAVDAYLGDLLWRIHRPDEGEELLQRALSNDPRQAMAHFSLGILRMRQNRFTESRRHFQKAVESDPQNYLAHYNYALMLQREQVDESQFVSHFADETVKSMREALGRARQLNPNFADTYKQLAFINLVLSEDLDEALDLIRRAIEIAPGREDFQYTLAQIQLRQKDYEAARLTARTLAAEGRNAEIRDRAKSLIEVIDKIEQQLARMKAESEERSNGSHSPPDAPQRPPLPGQRFKGDQVRGFLTRIDCTDTSITLTVRSGARIFKLHSPDRGKLIFVKYTPEIPNTVVCGAVNPASPVIVTYRASQQSRYDGEAIGVEFVKPDNL